MRVPRNSPVVLSVGDEPKSALSFGRNKPRPIINDNCQVSATESSTLPHSKHSVRSYCESFVHGQTVVIPFWPCETTQFPGFVAGSFRWVEGQRLRNDLADTDGCPHITQGKDVC